MIVEHILQVLNNKVTFLEVKMIFKKIKKIHKVDMSVMKEAGPQAISLSTTLGPIPCYMIYVQYKTYIKVRLFLHLRRQLCFV